MGSIIRQEGKRNVDNFQRNWINKCGTNNEKCNLHGLKIILLTGMNKEFFVCVGTKSKIRFCRCLKESTFGLAEPVLCSQHSPSAALTFQTGVKKPYGYNFLFESFPIGDVGMSTFPTVENLGENPFWRYSQVRNAWFCWT
jgi:hypothetical protein